jgi:hypothetical protein
MKFEYIPSFMPLIQFYCLHLLDGVECFDNNDIFYVLYILYIDILLCISPGILKKHEKAQVCGYPVVSRSHAL